MQEKSLRTLNTSDRLARFREAQGLEWGEVAKQLGISRVMLHYLRTGTKPIGVRLDFRLRKLEEQAGLATDTKEKVAYEPSRFDRFDGWMRSLQRRWNRSPTSRDEIRIALRVLFPKHADEIIEWLSE
jgi:transcriptional regulator with XRE-family HTH domain